jgi:hypothetical protein
MTAKVAVKVLPTIEPLMADVTLELHFRIMRSEEVEDTRLWSAEVGEGMWGRRDT